MAPHQALDHPWDSPGKNTGVGCHFLRQCMKVNSESEVAQSCPTLSDPMDCNLPGSSVHGRFQARVLEWGAIAFSWELTRYQQLCPALHRITKNETWLKWLSTHALHIPLHLIHNKIILELSHLQIMKSCSFGLLKNRHSILEMSILLLLLSHSLCLALSYPIGCRTLSFPVLHCPAELAQTHGHWVGDVIQATHPLSPYSLPLRVIISSVQLLSHVWFFAAL